LLTFATRKRVDGKFLGPGGSSVPEGQALLSGLLDACFDIVQDIKAREAEEDVSPPLKPIWERLTSMKQQLEQLSKFSWSQTSPTSANRYRSSDSPLDSARDGPLQVSNNSNTKCPQVPVLTMSSSYSVSLRDIDSMRVDGKFVDADGNKAEGQYVSTLVLHTTLPVPQC
jgi:hypothetical protein